MMFHKPKKNRCPRVNRILISITFMGSAGPIRLVVDETDPVDAVILTALKSYRREGRLPILGSNFEDFLLYYGSDGELFLFFSMIVRWFSVNFKIQSLIRCARIGSQLLVRGTQSGRKAPGISCCARSPRLIRGQPMLEENQPLSAMERAAEPGKSG
ncbi:hypothetical protein SAY86_013922 [Trapa natans]|uniref:DUF7054 domain-containing protein n=1 Tax=Trapa natans TaxID=22666 RepID=A0AAN7L039_TRANT|nr:hypothetical protein SAY86_013922 [Trapa natans]